MHFLQGCWCLHPNPTFLLGRHPWVSHRCGGSPSYPSPSSGSTSSTPPAAGMCRVLPPPQAAVWVTPVGTAGDGMGAMRRLHQLDCVCTAPVTHVGALPFPWDDVRAVLPRQILLQRAGRWAGGRGDPAGTPPGQHSSLPPALSHGANGLALCPHFFPLWLFPFFLLPNKRQLLLGAGCGAAGVLAFPARLQT